MRVPNLAALNSPFLIQLRTVCSWAPMRPAMSAPVSSWSAHCTSEVTALGHDPAAAPSRRRRRRSAATGRAGTESRRRRRQTRRPRRRRPASSRRRRRTSTCGRGCQQISVGAAMRANWVSTGCRSRALSALRSGASSSWRCEEFCDTPWAVSRARRLFHERQAVRATRMEDDPREYLRLSRRLERWVSCGGSRSREAWVRMTDTTWIGTEGQC
jgi:hypothetical protein